MKGMCTRVYLDTPNYTLVNENAGFETGKFPGCVARSPTTGNIPSPAVMLEGSLEEEEPDKTDDDDNSLYRLHRDSFKNFKTMAVKISCSTMNMG